MVKLKTTYICQNCGVHSPKWIGCCNSCGEWNSYVEEVLQKNTGHSPLANSLNQTKNHPTPLGEITYSDEKRVNTGIQELNRVLGGGIVPGSVILIGGEPGIGKSTLALQLVLKTNGFKTLYISGEESLQQIKLRADRLSLQNDQCLLLNETNIESILHHVQQQSPDLIIIDSVQTLFSGELESSPGTVTQVRECSNRIIQQAKTSNIPCILIGHINKEGGLAGPKVLEHMVDTVLQFEGDQHHFYRILRSRKNRFGSTSEMGIFEMTSTGLKEIKNPSEILLNKNQDDLSGIAVAATIDGIRPFLIEVQALVSSAVYGNPQRSTTGFDIKRLNMLLAVLEKRAGFHLSSKDVFLNIAGGIKVNDPAIDMAVICSVLSSNLDLAIDKGICFAAEIGLSGEVRPVNRIGQRVMEAEKLGFSTIFISKYNQKELESKKQKIHVVPVGRIEDLIRKLFTS